MNYPIPDPAWDYANLWQQLQETKGQLEELILSIAQVEEARPEIDQQIKEKLNLIGQALNSVRRLMVAEASRSMDS